MANLQGAVQKILEERGQTHGDFKCNAHTIQSMKETLRYGTSWDKLSFEQKESLEMIVHKIGRIVNGNPNEKDHWNDLIGYATLVANKL